MVHSYWPAENIVRIMDGSQIADLRYWYEMATISPWLTGKLLETLKLIGHGWEQTVETDPDTGKEQIIVTCNHPKSNTSALLVVDPESKLVLKAKLWNNLQREGRPVYDAQTIAYNPEVPEGLFELKVPPGAMVISPEAEEAGRALFNQAEALFHQEKKYAEAMEIYWQVYNTYPKLNVAEEALMMIGLSHGRLGQQDEAIAILEKAVSEYRHLKGWVDASWFYLGSVYLRTGQEAKALEAFENCLAAGEGVRDPEKFPLKDARAAIAKIKGE